jgi:MoaD family protein
MKVNFYGTFRLITRRKTVSFEDHPGMTLDDLLQQINHRFPKLGSELLGEGGHLYPYIPIYINGRNPRLLDQRLRVNLEPGDIVSIFSPISSGRINVETVNKSVNNLKESED